MKGKTVIIDEYSRKPLKVVESVSTTPDGSYSGVVLATLYGVLSDYGHETRNDRWYSGSLWKKVLNDDLFKEAIATRTLFGEADHPMDVEDRVESHIPYVSHIIRDVKLHEDEQVVKGYIDVIDTPTGRIVKTLIDYGCILGVSSRGCGDLTEENGKVVVDENSYTFVTWDIVARPSNKRARVHEIDTVDATGKSAFESLKSQVSQFIDCRDISSLKLTENLISQSKIPEKDLLLSKIHEGVNSIVESESSPVTSSEKAITETTSEESQKVSELESKNSELAEEIKDLKSELSQQNDTISDLSELNQNLGLMVKEYMHRVDHLTESSSLGADNLSGSYSDLKESITRSQRVQAEDLNSVMELFSHCIQKSHSSLSSKIRELSESLECATSNQELRRSSERVLSENKDLKIQINELQEKITNTQSEMRRLRKRVSNSTNEYFKVRCSQLGLNPLVVKREFRGDLTEYKISEINQLLTEMYSNSNSSKMTNLYESRTPKELGSIQVDNDAVNVNSSVSSMYLNADSDSAPDPSELDISMLAESIKAVRKGVL